MAFALIPQAGFSQPGLPIMPKFVDRSLAGAWRFKDTDAKLVDQSNRKGVLVPTGTPTFTALGVKVNNANGYTLPLSPAFSPAPKSLTIALVVRPNQDLTIQTPLIAGTWDPTHNRGALIYWGENNTGSGASYPRFGCYAKLNADGTQTNQGFDPATKPLYAARDRFRFVALVIDGAAEQIRGFLPYQDPDTSVVENGGTTWKVSNRDVLDAAGEPSFIKLGLLGDGSLAEVAELLVWYDALTDEELVTQLGYSSSYLANTSGIQVQ